MKITIKILINICLIAIIFQGCKGDSNIAGSPTKPIATPKTVNRITPTHHTLTSTKAPRLDYIMRNDCLTPRNSEGSHDLYEGLVLKGSRDVNWQNKMIGFNNTDNVFPEESSDFAVSPDRNSIAFTYKSKTSPTGQWLRIQNNEGEIKEIPAQKLWNTQVQEIYWIDNQRIVFNLWDINNPPYSILDQIVINPYSGVNNKLPSNYPNLELTISKLPHFGKFTVLYDPTLRYVVYAANYDEFILWDRVKTKAIATIPGFSQKQEVNPLWSEDGSKVFFPANPKLDDNKPNLDEWFSVDLLGNVKQLTHFDNLFKEASISESSLSPDGQKIAFWMGINGENDFKKLAILDLVSGEVTNLCVQGYADYYDWNVPIWSPDGSYLAVLSTDFSHSKNQPIIIDLQNHWKTSFLDGYHPVGWMNPSK
jgi:hypothetical protein